MAYTLSHQTPTATAISWSGVHIVYDGVDYTVADGNTTDKFVYWLLSDPTVFQTSNTYPSLSVSDAIVFINSLGIGLSVLESSIIEGSLVIPGTIQAGALAANSVSADNIVAGAITADKVAADAITANKIVAGAITAEKISASAITADKIAIGSTKNLLPTSTWKEADITPLEMGYANNMAGHTPLLAWRAADSYSFGETVELKMSGATTPPSGAIQEVLLNDPIIVTGGAYYEISGYLNPHRCAARVGVLWYDATDAYISESLGNAITNHNQYGDVMSNYARSYQFIQAPTNAKTGKVFIRTTYDGQADPRSFFLRLMLGECLSGQTQPSAWASAGGGGVTTIDGDKIITGTIDASKLNVANLSAISANMGNLTSGTITLDNAGHIKGGQTDYNTGSGFFMGYQSGTYKFSIGTPTNGMTWNGAALTIKGDLVAGSINLGGNFTADNNGAITIKSAASGQRVEIYNDVIKVYDSTGTLRVKLGNLSA